MDVLELRNFESLSPFEIKDELIKLAKKTSRTTRICCAVEYFSASSFIKSAYSRLVVVGRRPCRDSGLQRRCLRSGLLGPAVFAAIRLFVFVSPPAFRHEMALCDGSARPH